MELSRLLITGPLNIETPFCVVKEVADAHGIKYDGLEMNPMRLQSELLLSIETTKIQKITSTEGNGVRDIARFINKYTPWPLSKLLLAFNFLNKFIEIDNPLKIIPTNFKVGLQTPDNPESINSSVLFKICKYHGIKLTTETSIEDMFNVVNMLREPNELLFDKVKNIIVGGIGNPNLVNILINFGGENLEKNNNVEIAHNMLENVHRTLTDIRYLQNNINPSNNQGAIALAAINYNIDISKSSCPINEYKKLKLLGRTDYKPIDKWMQRWFIKNPIIFDLTVSFNPLFPQSYYNPNDLINMTLNSGYKNEDIIENSHYELLQMAHVEETFYYGEMPNLKTKETPISLTNIDDIPYGQLLSYGSCETSMNPISIEELIELFTNNENFSNPFSTITNISSLAINKLKLMSQSHIGHIPGIKLSEETISFRKTLHSTILSIENNFRFKDESTRQLVSSYRNSDPETKTLIHNTLVNLLNVGMYMRGWNGTDDYPIVTAYVPIERNAEIALNVTNAINEYETLTRRLGKIGLQINNLPLVLYKDKEYHVSNSSKEGLTINERIKIVKEGDKTSNTSSCIRLSSNWICSSAHKYLTALNFPSPFDIFYLRHIS
jgi:hypothetical protein